MSQNNSSDNNLGLPGNEPELYAFRAKARIISEIGDELISSDAIALYELIKNAYDAGSSSALVEISTPLVPKEIEELTKQLKSLLDIDASSEEIEIEVFGKLLLMLNDESALKKVKEALKQRDEFIFETTLKREVQRLSMIHIADEGHGMNQKILQDAFLAVGTPMRKQQRKQQRGSRIPLGEKGVGRFSAKRLGNYLRVETMTTDEPRVYYLEIDWYQYASDSDLFLDEVKNPLWSKSASSKRRAGTTLVIKDLNEIWDLEKTQLIARNHLSKLMNPFFPNDFRIVVRFNRTPVNLIEFQQEILQLARLRVTGRVHPDAKDVLKYQLVYKKEKKEVTISEEDQNLKPISELRKMGAFRFEIYEFDRQDPTIERVGRKRITGAFIDQWGGGGLMLFRDGFRILPYGNRGNDWLDIDQKFFKMRTNGPRLRTYAILGYVAITSKRNPYLVDQTNREGLRENEAYHIFRETIERIIELINLEYAELERSSKEKPEKVAKKLSETEKQLEKSVQKAFSVVSELEVALHESSDTEQSRALITKTSNIIQEIRDYSHNYKEVGQSLQKQLSLDGPRYQSLLELASLGMTAEQVSHELNSLLDRIQGLLTKLSANLTTSTERALMGQLTANLQSLRRLAEFLEPLTKASRQKRIELDVAEELKTVALHYPELASNRTQFEIITNPEDSSLKVSTNRGLLLQIFDNLLANSLYWLNNKQIPNPKIVIQINIETKSVVFEDNGLGVDINMAELVFQPFISTKPNGRGLGLFIVRELLELEGCQIILLDDRNPEGRLYRFQIDLSKLAK
jgi:signal transduction histidine kinase